MKSLNRKQGGTWGFIALGIIKTTGRYGHMGGWYNEFQAICIEKVELLSGQGIILKAQPEKARMKISVWFANEARKQY